MHCFLSRFERRFSLIKINHIELWVTTVYRGYLKTSSERFIRLCGLRVIRHRVRVRLFWHSRFRKKNIYTEEFKIHWLKQTNRYFTANQQYDVCVCVISVFDKYRMKCNRTTYFHPAKSNFYCTSHRYRNLTNQNNSLNKHYSSRLSHVSNITQ